MCFSFFHANFFSSKISPRKLPVYALLSSFSTAGVNNHDVFRLAEDPDSEDSRRALLKTLHQIKNHKNFKQGIPELDPVGEMNIKTEEMFFCFLGVGEFDIFYSFFPGHVVKYVFYSLYTNIYIYMLFFTPCFYHNVYIYIHMHICIYIYYVYIYIYAYTCTSLSFIPSKTMFFLIKTGVTWVPRCICIYTYLDILDF